MINTKGINKQGWLRIGGLVMLGLHLVAEWYAAELDEREEAAGLLAQLQPCPCGGVGPCQCEDDQAHVIVRPGGLLDGCTTIEDVRERMRDLNVEPCDVYSEFEPCDCVPEGEEPTGQAEPDMPIFQEAPVRLRAVNTAAVTAALEAGRD